MDKWRFVVCTIVHVLIIFMLTVKKILILLWSCFVLFFLLTKLKKYIFLHFLSVYNLPPNHTSNNKYDQHMQMSPLQSIPNSWSRNLKSIKIHYVRYSKSLFQTKIYLVRNKINSKTVYKLEFFSHNMKKFGCVFQ